MAKNENSIKNVTDLRDHALWTIQRLANGEIDTAEAGVTGKLCESVISTIKAQLEYARMTKEEVAIPFMQYEKGNLIEHSTKSHPALPDKRK